MADTPETHSSLLLRIRNPGDGEAWGEFAGIYAPLIHRYCLRRGLQDADAADVAQDVMLAVSRAIGRFELNDIKGSFRSWLFKITRNTVADFLDRRNRGPQGGGGSTVRRIVEAQPDPTTDGLWDREYQRWIFDRACDRVRGEFEESTWQAFWRTAVDSHKGEEVAQALGLSLGAVYIAKSRVLARLKERVREVSDGSPFLEGN